MENSRNLIIETKTSSTIKTILKLFLFQSCFFSFVMVTGQELYTAAHAASALNEVNSIGSTSDIVGIGCTTSVESTIVAVGSYSYKGTSEDGTADRIEVTPTLTSGVDYEMKVHLAEGDGANINPRKWVGVTVSNPIASPLASAANATLQEFTILFTTTSDTPIFRFYNDGLAGTDIYLDNISIVQVGTDTQSPTAPTLSSIGQTDTTADLSWTGATDDTAVTGYRIYQDGVLEVTLGNVSTYQVTGLTAGTNYNFTATALDAAGNESPVSNAVSVTTNGSGGGGGTVWTEANSVASYTGNVAVGTAIVPNGYQMAIDGKLITEEVKVQLSGDWPDYVFSPDYTLPTLEEVYRHINEKGHLINIPSATEVEANGIELGDMNKLLLEKIEELTLYILQQEQNQKLLHKNLEALQKEMSQIRTNQ
jgi:chitodextrinase